MATKHTVMTGAVGGMTIGSLIPWLFGDYNSFDVWSLGVGPLIGGVVGIWLAVWLSKKLDF